MTNTEQMTTIQELSDVISHKMGLREQLEVIRIMNPEASVLHTDTEFVISKSSNQSPLYWSDNPLSSFHTKPKITESLREVPHLR